jgi:hypothetical protein
VDVSAASGPGATTPASSRGAAFADLDGDGDTDALVMNMNARPSLLRTDLGRRGRGVRVALEGTRSNAQGIGATVLLSAGGRTQARAVLSQASYYSVDDLRPHFGLGGATRIERIEVRWPSGMVDVIGPLAATSEVRIREGSSPSY